MERSNRSGDPEAWRCLDDKQRDIIAEWYSNRLAEHEKKEDTQVEFWKSSLFASNLITALVFSIWRTLDFFKAEYSFWQFVDKQLLYFAIYGISSFVCAQAYIFWAKRTDAPKTKMEKVLRAIAIVFATAFIAVVVYGFVD